MRTRFQLIQAQVASTVDVQADDIVLQGVTEITDPATQDPVLSVELCSCNQAQRQTEGIFHLLQPMDKRKSRALILILRNLN